MKLRALEAEPAPPADALRRDVAEIAVGLDDYVVAEALTNAAKHAHASSVRIEADVLDGDLRVSVQDDGVGGLILPAGPASSG